MTERVNERESQAAPSNDTTLKPKKAEDGPAQVPMERVNSSGKLSYAGSPNQE